jgi:hypothetical protein
MIENKYFVSIFLSSLYVKFLLAHLHLSVFSLFIFSFNLGTFTYAIEISVSSYIMNKFSVNSLFW